MSDASKDLAALFMSGSEKPGHHDPKDPSDKK